MLVATAAHIRKADEIMMSDHQFPGLLLMETAGRKCAEFLLSQYPDAPLFFILAGPGNNGGDGLVIARYLWRAAKKVQILFSADPQQYKGDAKTNYLSLQSLNIPSQLWNHGAADALVNTLPADAVIVDALLGTGASQPLKDPIAAIIAHFSAAPCPVVAIDLPSGLSADTGALTLPPLRAAFTLTFQLSKPCHWLSPAAACCGEVVIVDIGIYCQVTELLGIRCELLTPEWVRQRLHTRPIDGHKGSFGHVLIAGGSKDMAGAPSLASRAALAAGAGLSSAFIPGSIRNAFFQLGAEVMTHSGSENEDSLNESRIPDFKKIKSSKNAVAIGPGMGTSVASAAFLKAALQDSAHPLILDADALNLLAAHDLWSLLPPHCILTPHPGEMCRLMGNDDCLSHRLESAQAMARERNVIVVLKGAGTIVALPDGASFINFTGNPGMATAGAGDVLTGVIAGLLAQGYSPAEAAALGVCLHGVAGDLAADVHSQAGVTAEKILIQLGPARKAIENNWVQGPRCI